MRIERAKPTIGKSSLANNRQGSFCYGSRVAVPVPNPPVVWVNQYFCPPAPTNRLRVGPLGTDKVPVQSAATVYVPPGPAVLIIVVPPMFTVPKSLLNVPSPLNRLPSITVFGTRFPPKFAYPSQLDKYKPLSVCSLQTCQSAAAAAVPDVPIAITATRQTNAQAKSK